MGVTFAVPCFNLGQVAAPNCVEPRGWKSFDLKCQECQDIGSWTEYKSKSCMKSNLSNPLFSNPTIWGPCLSGSSKNIWSIAHGKIETTPFQVRAPSPPRGLETPIGPAEDAERGGHGYDSSDCTCHAYHLWKSSCLQWRAHRYHVAPMVKKLTKPCLVVWMDTVWTAKKKKTTGLTNLVTILAAKTIIRWIINHESTMFSTSRSKPGWDDWWDPSFACQCLATWSTPWGLGLGWALRAATTVSAEVCTRKCCRTTPWRWQSLFDWKGIQMMTICMRFIYIYIYIYVTDILKSSESHYCQVS